MAGSERMRENEEGVAFIARSSQSNRQQHSKINLRVENNQATIVPVH